MNQAPLLYITGNYAKFAAAANVLQKYGMTIEQKALEIPEIQAANTEEVALDKAFAIVKSPLLVSDHGWLIAALNGFPGPYMKYINDWFTPDNFLALMKDQENREITLRQNLVYIDQNTTKSFTHDLKGYVLEQAAGDTGQSWNKVICLSGDGKSVAQSKDASGSPTVLMDEPEPWASFADWWSNR